MVRSEGVMALVKWTCEGFFGMEVCFERDEEIGRRKWGRDESQDPVFPH